MPALPSARDLGKIGSFDSHRPIASVDLSAPARALEGFGKSLRDAAGSFANQVGRDRREAETDRDTLELTKANSHWRAKTDELNTKYTTGNDPDHPTWGSRHAEDVKKAAEEAAGMITSPKRRALFSAQVNGEAPRYTLNVTERAKGIDRAAKRQEFEEVLDKNLIMATEGDPARGDRIMAETKAAIDSAARTGIYSPAEAQERWRSLRARRAGGLVEKDIERDPEGAAVRLGSGPVGSRAAEAMRILQSKGWTPVQAAGWVGRLFQESQLNPNARNPGDGRDGSDSIGINQWNSGRAAALKAFAASRGKDWNDFATQVEFIDHEARNSVSERTALYAMREAKTPEEAAKAAMHFARPAGYTSMNPERGHGYDNTLRHTQRLAGGVGGAYQDLTSEQRRQYGHRAESQATRMDADRRIEARQLSSLIADDFNSIQQTGKPLETVTRDKVEELLGKVEAERFDRGRQNAQLYHEATRDFDVLPNNQIIGKIESARPQGGLEGYTEAHGTYETVAKRGSAIIAEREHDPAKAVEKITSVRKAREAAEYDGDGTSKRIKPESMQSIVRARINAQSEMGISRVHAVTRGEASVIARQLRAIGEDDIDGLNSFLTSMRMTYGPYADDVLNSSIEYQNVNRELAKVATDILRTINLGRIPDISSIRKLDANLAWGTSQPGMLGGAPSVSTSDILPPATGGSMEGFPMPPSNQEVGVVGDSNFRADVEFLVKNRDNPNVLFEFDSKYNDGTGKGRSETILKDLDRRLNKGKK